MAVPLKTKFSTLHILFLVSVYQAFGSEPLCCDKENEIPAVIERFCNHTSIIGRLDLLTEEKQIWILSEGITALLTLGDNTTIEALEESGISPEEIQMFLPGEFDTQGTEPENLRAHLIVKVNATRMAKYFASKNASQFIEKFSLILDSQLGTLDTLNFSVESMDRGMDRRFVCQGSCDSKFILNGREITVRGTERFIVVQKNGLWKFESAPRLKVAAMIKWRSERKQLPSLAGDCS